MKHFKRLYVFLFLLPIIALTSCKTTEYKDAYEDGYFFKYNSILTTAYCCGYYSETGSSERSIDIPLTYNKANITDLGSNDDGFYVRIKALNKATTNVKMVDISNLSYYENLPGCKIESLEYNLFINKNITNIYPFKEVIFVYEETYFQSVKCYIVTYKVTCDEENPKYYAKNNKLYLKADDSLVTNIPYQED